MMIFFYIVVIVIVLRFITISVFNFIRARKVIKYDPLTTFGGRYGAPLRQGKTMLLFFYHPRDRRARKISPIIDQLAARKYPVFKVDASKETELAEKFMVRFAPVIIIARPDKIIHYFANQPKSLIFLESQLKK